MDIFYLKKSEFLESIELESLEYFSDGRKYASQVKCLEHLCGLFLVKFVAKHIYKIDNLEIEIIDKKPIFKDSELSFSISHSKDIVLVAFDCNNVGADVEFISERPNYEAILERCGKNIPNPTLEDFYKFWTLYEAEFKLGAEVKSLFNTQLEDKYMLTCVSDNPLVSTFTTKKMVLNGENVDLRDELGTFEKCQFILSVE